MKYRPYFSYMYSMFYQVQYRFCLYLTDELRLSNHWDDFPNQSMGVTEIDGMNEKDEMELTDNCMDVLGFEPEEKQNIYQVVAAVMHLGTMKFKQRGREEQAEADGTKVCSDFSDPMTYVNILLDA